MQGFLKHLYLTGLLLLSFATSNAQYQMMGTYSSSGRPNYLVVPGDSVSTEMLDKLKATLPEYRRLHIYNPQLISKTRPETILLNCVSDVWITFVSEGASYLNSLGFYTYNIDTPRTTAPTPANIKIIFPNASLQNSGGGLKTGDKVYLGKFPAKTAIGFVFLSNAWNGSAVTTPLWSLYSNSSFNPEPDTNWRKHTVLIRDTATNRLIIAIEDVRRDDSFCDHDFNDMIFYATVNPFNCVGRVDSIPDLTNDGHISFSGNTGGLESSSLGDKLAKRYYKKIISNDNGDVNYKNMQLLDQEQLNVRSLATANLGISLAKIMPTRILDTGYTAYISTPTDLTGMTNAVEVRAVDFTQNNTCRAVAFATKTFGEMYNHTKPICDRLKGAELIGMDNFMLNELNFVRYILKQETGNIEYSLSFTIGKKKGRNTFSFQSNWLNYDYIPEDTLINYQLWAKAPYLCTDMALEILDRLNAIMPVQQYNASAPLPKTYITSGFRDGSTLNLTVNNETSYTSGYFSVEERASETNALKSKRTIPFTIKARGKTALSFPMKDVLESNVSMYVNGKLEDVVFMSDGPWTLNYDTAKTVINNFTVTNDDSSFLNPGDYRLFRNVAIETKSTNDYVSVYKLLRGGGALQNLNKFRTLCFTGKAGTNLRIILVKNAITNFSDQFQVKIPVSKNMTDYAISLDDFKSPLSSERINAEDISSIIFAYEVIGTKAVDFSAVLNNVRFTEKSADYFRSLQAGEIEVYPNPAVNSRFNAGFKTEVNTTVTIKLIDAASGKTVYSKNMNTITGINSLSIQLDKQVAAGIYLLTVEGDQLNFTPRKLVLY